MENNTNNNPQTFADEESSSFNIMEWLLELLHYWYLFVIGAALALGMSYFKNRSWLPAYRTSGTIIIQEYARNNASSLMQGFGVDAGYTNVNNQVIMLTSYDLMCRVVDSLPFMNVDYISQGRFRTRNLYKSTPIQIEATYVNPSVEGLLFQCNLKKDGSYKITVPDNKDFDSFSLTGRYGQPIENDLFSFVLYPTQNVVSSGTVYFRFRSRESLVADFSSRLQLGFVSDKSSVLALTLVSETPERDKDFIDKLSELYLLQNLERKNHVANTTISFINDQLTTISQSLSVSEGAMTDFRRRNEIVDMQSHSSELLGRITTYDQEKMSLRLKETYFDYLTNYLHTNMESESVVAPSTMGLDESALTGLVTQLNDTQIKRSELSEKNVYYAKYTKDLENIKKAILEVLKSMRATLNIEKQDLDLRYKEARTGIAQLPEKELEMVALERNYRIDDNYYTFFLQKRAESEIQKASNMPDNDIMDKARILDVTNAGTKSRNISMFLAIGLLIPAAFVVLKKLLNNKIMTAQDAEKLSSFKLLGMVRHTRSQDPTIATKRPRSSYTEQLRALRTRVEFVAQRKVGLTVLTTSAQSGDGKTYISTNMAALYAMTGKKTLLIDMDIRKPNIHEKLGMSMKYGMTNYLIGEATLEDIIIKDPAYQFDMIFAGTVPPNPGELVRSDQVREVMALLKKQYDYILIDTSPIGLVADAYALLEFADITLFVVRCNKTQKNFCKGVLEQMQADKTENVYVVLSDVPYEGQGYNVYSNRYGYGYGYGNHYGYGYGSHYGYGYGYGTYGSKKKRQEAKNQYTNYYTDDDI